MYQGQIQFATFSVGWPLLPVLGCHGLTCKGIVEIGCLLLSFLTNIDDLDLSGRRWSRSEMVTWWATNASQQKQSSLWEQSTIKISVLKLVWNFLIGKTSLSKALKTLTLIIVMYQMMVPAAKPITDDRCVPHYGSFGFNVMNDTSFDLVGQWVIDRF